MALSSDLDTVSSNNGCVEIKESRGGETWAWEVYRPQNVTAP